MVLKVLLVRHAQSENNIVQASVHVKMRDGLLSPEESQVRVRAYFMFCGCENVPCKLYHSSTVHWFKKKLSQAEWLALRREDPGLSPDGLKQTVQLAKHLATSDIVHDVKR